MINVLAVFLGGGLGATTRYFLNILLPKNLYCPCSTLVANFLGCFIATAIFTYLVSRQQIPSFQQTLLITGFCGGLSTLSALSLEVMVFFQQGDYFRGIFYILTSLIVCIFSVLLGIFLIKKYF